MPDIRFRVDPADIPAVKAARRLGLDEDAFTRALPELLSRGFPPPDQTTGMFDLDAIDRWRRKRHAHLFPEDASLTAPPAARDAREVVADRLARVRGG